MLPILHLNGYKIANPTVLARIPDDELESLMVGYGHKPHMFVAGFDDESHEDIHRRFATLLDEVLDEIAEIKRSAHAGNEQRPQWPMIVFRTPRAGRGRTTSTARRRRARGARTRCRWPTRGTPPSTSTC